MSDKKKDLKDLSPEESEKVSGGHGKHHGKHGGGHHGKDQAKKPAAAAGTPAAGKPPVIVIPPVKK